MCQRVPGRSIRVLTSQRPLSFSKHNARERPSRSSDSDDSDKKAVKPMTVSTRTQPKSSHRTYVASTATDFIKCIRLLPTHLQDVIVQAAMCHITSRHVGGGHSERTDWIIAAVHRQRSWMTSSIESSLIFSNLWMFCQHGKPRPTPTQDVLASFITTSRRTAQCRVAFRRRPRSPGGRARRPCSPAEPFGSGALRPEKRQNRARARAGTAASALFERQRTSRADCRRGAALPAGWPGSSGAAAGGDCRRLARVRTGKVRSGAAEAIARALERRKQHRRPLIHGAV
jgi:hypothetical protein